MNGKSIVRKIAYSPLFKSLAINGKGWMMDLRFYYYRKGLENDAKKYYNNGSTKGTFADYKQALKKHWVSYSEYAHQYEFYKKTEEEREEFISRLKMRYFYRKYAPSDNVQEFFDKEKFLQKYSKYIYRKWSYAPKATFTDFEHIVSNFDCIYKPVKGSLGMGIFKTCKTDAKKDDRTFYETCVKEKILVEQCIEECDELKAFHPQSLNTLRVVTISNKEKAEVLGSFFRMGVGNSIIDNAHANGVFAQINIKDGTIESDGIDVSGNSYVCHPDSKLKLKGFKIPKWDCIVETCCEAAMMTGNFITGWDVVINKDGMVEFIEGNCGPDFDVMQSPLKVGIKSQVFTLIKEYYGIEMR